MTFDLTDKELLDLSSKVDTELAKRHERYRYILSQHRFDTFQIAFGKAYDVYNKEQLLDYINIWFDNPKTRK